MAADRPGELETPVPALDPRSVWPEPWNKPLYHSKTVSNRLITTCKSLTKRCVYVFLSDTASLVFFHNFNPLMRFEVGVKVVGGREFFLSNLKAVRNQLITT